MFCPLREYDTTPCNGDNCAWWCSLQDGSRDGCAITILAQNSQEFIREKRERDYKAQAARYENKNEV